MDREESLVCQFQDHHLEEVAGAIRTDDQDLGRVRIGVDVNDDQRMVDGVVDIDVRDAVTTGGLVNLHTSLS